MKILLINPPFHRLKGLQKTYYPLGLGYLGSALEQAGFAVKLYQAENAREPLAKIGLKNKNQLMLQMYRNYLQALNHDEHPVWQEITRVIADEGPDIIGISCMTVYLASALKIAAIVKKQRPSCRIVVGGPHPTLLTDAVLQRPEIDFVIQGEAEATFVELAQALASGNDWQQIAGLSWRSDHGISHNPRRDLIRDLDTLPPPLRSSLVFPESFAPTDLGVVITSRGCPFSCTFCSAKSMWGRQVRYRSIANVMAELKMLVQDYHFKELFFWDDSFTVDRRRTLELCRSIRDEKLGISWGCTTRLDLLDDELLAAMKQAGCAQIDVGIESGSEPILKAIKKGVTLAQIERGIQLIHKHHIFATAFFMIGFPDETVEDIQQTFTLMQTIPATITFSVFTPYPGTELFEYMQASGLVAANSDWSELSHHSPNNYFSRNIDRSTFAQLVEQGASIVDSHNNRFIYKYYYLRDNFAFYLRNPRFLIYKMRKYL